MVAGRRKLAIGLGFCWVAPVSRWGNFNFFNLKSQLNYFQVILVFLPGGVGVGFLQQWEEDTFEQLLHSCGGGPTNVLGRTLPQQATGVDCATSSLPVTLTFNL